MITATLLSCLLASQATGLQSFIRVPTYSETNPGEAVVLGCEVENKGGECRWEKDGSPVGLFPGKYEWAGDVTAGNCSILILEASAEYDDGVWQCQVTASNFKKGDSLISDGAEVVVRTAPARLYFMSKQGVVEPSQQAVNATAGSRMDIKCVTTGGNPVPRISFSLAGRPLVTENSQLNKRLAGGGWESSLQLSYIPSRSEDGARLGCEVLHEALRAPLESEARLSVSFAPTVVRVTTNTSRADQGETVSLQCQVEANPRPAILWSRLSQPGVVLGRGENFLIRNIDQSRDDVYVCQAENEVGIGEGRSEPIKTNHAPVIHQVGPSDNIMLILGQSLSLSCSAEASPPPRYTWLHTAPSGHSRVVSEDGQAQLVVEAVTYEESGEYFCVAENTLAGEVRQTTSQPILVEVRGAPVIQEEEEETRLVSGGAGGSAQVRIKFCSNPTPVLSWRLDQDILTQNHRREFDIETNTADHCATSVLRLRDLTEEDSGFYLLTVENDHGHSVQRIQLVVTKSLLSREIIIAIVAGSLLTTAILLFVVISRCCSARAEAGTEVKDVESCGTSTTSDNNKNEKLEQSDDDIMVFNESYEKFEHDIFPTSLAPAYKHSYNELCNFPRSSNGGSMRVSNQRDVDKMINMYNSNILDHINTINYSNYNKEDNIYYYRQNFDNKIYS